LIAVAIGALVLALAAGCGGRRDAVRPTTPQRHAVQIGTASWYGREFAGRRTASGEIFRPQDLTAAHRTLPFGTQVRVINVENGRKIDVRINDRGPFTRHRILDVSEAAARKLGFHRRGLARVRLEYPEPNGAKP
jgi:rare lipoprotein A